MNKKLFKLLSISALVTSVNFPAVIAMELKEQSPEEKINHSSNTKKNTGRIPLSIYNFLREYCDNEFHDDKNLIDSRYSKLLEVFKSIYNYRSYNNLSRSYVDDFFGNFFYLKEFLTKYKDKLERILNKENENTVSVNDLINRIDKLELMDTSKLSETPSYYSDKFNKNMKELFEKFTNQSPRKKNKEYNDNEYNNDKSKLLSYAPKKRYRDNDSGLDLSTLAQDLFGAKEIKKQLNHH